MTRKTEKKIKKIYFLKKFCRKFMNFLKFLIPKMKLKKLQKLILFDYN